MIDDRNLEAPWVGKTPEEYHETEQKVACACDSCGYAIYVGEEYYEINDMRICVDCISDYKKIAEE